mmetsp:Transcript_26000/g.38203  ORF Transcript_26000/g.38203 Transcript_26000/m.38203 type:complete len:341 (+) Transcript_26000:119-1141(+)
MATPRCDFSPIAAGITIFFALSMFARDPIVRAGTDNSSNNGLGKPMGFYPNYQHEMLSRNEAQQRPGHRPSASQAFQQLPRAKTAANEYLAPRLMQTHSGATTAAEGPAGTSSTTCTSLIPGGPPLPSPLCSTTHHAGHPSLQHFLQRASTGTARAATGHNNLPALIASDQPRAAARKRQGQQLPFEQLFASPGPPKKPHISQILPQGGGRNPESFPMPTRDHPLWEGNGKASTAPGLMRGGVLGLGPVHNPLGCCGGTQSLRPEAEALSSVRTAGEENAERRGGQWQHPRGEGGERIQISWQQDLWPALRSRLGSPTSTRRMWLGQATSTRHSLPKHYS